MNEILEKQHAILVTEFDRYVVEHPEFAASIPRNAQVVFQFGQDEAYNQWSAQLAQRQREKGQDVIYVKIEALKPARSRLVKPKVAVG